MQNKETTP